MASYREILMEHIEAQTRDRELWPDEEFHVLVETARKHADSIELRGFDGEAYLLETMAWAWFDGWLAGWDAAINIDGDEDDGDDEDDDFDPTPENTPGKALPL